MPAAINNFTKRDIFEICYTRPLLRGAHENGDVWYYTKEFLDWAHKEEEGKFHKLCVIASVGYIS